MFNPPSIVGCAVFKLLKLNLNDPEDPVTHFTAALEPDIFNPFSVLLALYQSSMEQIR